MAGTLSRGVTRPPEMMDCSKTLCVAGCFNGASMVWSGLPLQRRPDTGEVMIAVPHCVILQHELTCEWGIGVERHGGGLIELLVAERPNGGRSGRAVTLSRSSAAPFVTASCSLACRALISCTASHVTPATGLPPASVCASWISSGYIVAT